MSELSSLRLKKNEDKRLRTGHVWIFSNEIDTASTPLKHFLPGDEVIIQSFNKLPLGVGYINPHSLITARLFSRQLTDRLNVDFFIEKMKQAYSLRLAFFSQPFYRLIFSESDGLPGLIVDRYGEVLVIQINTAGMERRQNIIVEALTYVIPEVASIIFRNDSTARKMEGLEEKIFIGFGPTPEKLVLEENGVVFEAPTIEGQKTGWFYDHRANRARLSTYVVNKKVLDVFSYLGGWGVQAAKMEAKEVTCIDSSILSSTWINANAKLNNVSDKITVITGDAFIAMKKLIQVKEKYEVVILDPPAFIKKQKDKKEGFIAYQRLNELALKLLTNEGILISCSCSMHLSADDLIQAIRRAGTEIRCELNILEKGHQGLDHPIHLAIPETDYLKMMVVYKK